MWILILQRMFLQFFLGMVYFPVWWYTLGLQQIGLACYHLFQEGNYNLSPGLWLKNIFVPMFGQSDWQGRIMSFFMRLVNVIGRGIALFVWLVFVLILFIFWIIFPIFVVSMIAYGIF